MTKTLKFKCTLESDLVLSQTSSSEGNQKTLDFIPGNNFLGIVASKLYKGGSAESLELFHSGKVRFGDAHPSVDGIRGLKVPASMYYPKLGSAGTECYICWNEDTNTSIASLDSTGSNGTYYKMTYCGEKDNFYNYYVDIPKTATHAFFACENWAEGKQQSDLTADNWKKRTQTLWNLGGDGQSQLQSKVYKLTSTVSGGNTQVETPPHSVTGACINNYYNTIFVTTGSTFNAALSNTTNIPLRTDYAANYIGSLEYYSGDTSVFTVGKTTGVITPVGAGEATLYTKAVGSSYSDSQQVETTVKVTAADNYVFNDVPIVKNVKMAANETVDVNWYVINNSTTNALSYEIDEIYIGN